MRDSMPNSLVRDWGLGIGDWGLGIGDWEKVLPSS